MRQNDSYLTKPLCVTLVAWLLICSALLVVVPAVVGQAWEQKSASAINNYVQRHKETRVKRGVDASKEWYHDWARAYVAKVEGVATLFVTAVAALAFSPRARRRFTRFLLRPADPVNLAVLRVVIFCLLFTYLLSEPIVVYSAWPSEQFQWPAVASIVMKWMPVSPALSETLLTIALVTTVMSIFGFFSRVSACVSILLAIYLLAIPQASGKVNHSHHLILIGAVVALSRCGDALSLDSLWLSIRRADCGQTSPLPRKVCYGLPIRLSMLILATVYFFPGYWKLANGGPAWVFSDNLRNTMLGKWFELETYQPLLPFHDVPVVPQLGALAALVFEIGFPIAILFVYSRAAWALLGLSFHNLTGLMLGIWFTTLQAMYVLFIDWGRFGAWLGRRLFKGRLVVLYDDQCKLCRRTVALLGTADLFSQLQPIGAIDRSAVERFGLAHLDEESLMTDMHAVGRSRDGVQSISRGYDAYRAIAWRLPLLWPMAPLLGFAPVAAVGRRVYRRVADSRACSIVSPAKASTAKRPASSKATGWVLALAGLILTAQISLGIGRVMHAWPVACYPLFDNIRQNKKVWPQFIATMADGRQIELDDDPLRAAFGPARYVSVLNRTINGPSYDKRRDVVRALVKVWQSSDELPAELPANLKVFAETYELTGATRPASPIDRELIDVYPWEELVLQTSK